MSRISTAGCCVWMVAVSAVMILAAPAAFAEALTFEQFSRKVLAYYPQLKAAHANVDMALARKMQASAGFWPSVSVSAGMTETDDPVNVFGLLMRQERFSQADFDLNRLNTPRHQRDFQGGVHLRWPLFDAMQTIRRTRAAGESIKAAEHEERYIRTEAFLIAHDAFTHALALNKLKALADEADIAAQEDLKKAQELKDKGVVQGADFYAAKVRAGRFIQSRNDLSRQVKAMKMLLNIMMGDPVLADVEVAAVLPEGSFEEMDVAGLVQGSLQRADLAAAQSRVKARQEDWRRAADSQLPTIVVTADGINNRHDLLDRGGNNAAAGVKAEIPLFDPAREGRVKEAAAALTRARLEVDSLKDAIAVEIAREAARFDALRSNYAALKDMAEDSARAVEMLLPLYNEGRKSIIDLEDAREARFSVQSAFEELKAGLLTSQARLYFLSGKIDESGMKELIGAIEG